MKRYILFILIFGVLGLIIGYLFFGKIAGEYVNVTTIFSSSQNVLESFGRNISGITNMKQNILISGGVGVVLGFIIVFIRRK